MRLATLAIALLVLSTLGCAGRGPILRTSDARVEVDSEPMTTEQLSDVLEGIYAWGVPVEVVLLPHREITPDDVPDGTARVMLANETSCPPMAGHVGTTWHRPEHRGKICLDLDAIPASRLATITSHEIGHAFGLEHDDSQPGIMVSVMRTITEKPTCRDAEKLAAPAVRRDCFAIPSRD